jgi:hypothetical protein
LSRRVHGLFEINVSKAESDLELRVNAIGNNEENYNKTVEEFVKP